MNRNMIELRECPFCGSKMIEIYEIGIYDWIAQCNYCHSSGMRAASANDAAKAWNTRKEDRKKKLELSSVYGKCARERSKNV